MNRAMHGHGDHSLAGVRKVEQAKAFVETLEDLRRRCSLTATEYDAVQAAGLIRRLLIDAFSLGLRQASSMGFQPKANWYNLTQVRELASSGQRIEAATIYMDPELFHELGGARVAAAHPAMLVVKPVKRFLAATALRAESDEGGVAETVRIHDLVKHYAVSEGGVHYSGRAKSPLLQAARDEIEDELRLMLITAGRVIYRAFEPALIRAAFPERILNPQFSATVDDVVGVSDAVEAEVLSGGDVVPG